MNAERYEKPTIDLKRFKWVFILIGLVFTYYVFQLFQYQIVMGETYRDQADDNRTMTISDPTLRGKIYDRNGVVLAQNIPSYNITITPAELPDPDDNPGDLFRILNELSKVIDMPISSGDFTAETAKSFTPCATDFGIQEVVTIAYTNWPFQATRLKCNVSREVALIVGEKSMDWPGVGVEVEPIREYPTGIYTAEIVGFLGPVPEGMVDYYEELGFVSGRDKVGYAGLEASMQNELGGTNGKRVVEVTVAGEVKRNLEEPIPPVPGQDVYTTIDIRLQRVARDALEMSLNFWNNYFGKVLSNSGVVIALDAKTREVLAMVNVPSYENNRMSRYIPGYYYNQLMMDEAKPLVNKAITSELPPGSVYKLVPALGVLNEGVVTPEYTVHDPGIIYLEQKFYEKDLGLKQEYRCWDYRRGGHGNVDFLHGLMWSCNTYWYKVGGGYEDEIKDGGLGIWRMSEYAKALGYGQLTGIELPGEAAGNVPDPTWKRLNIGENWATGDTYLAAVGQGYVLATPLQVTNSIATVANNGKHMQVGLISKVVDAEGNVTQQFQPKELWDITRDPMIHSFNGNTMLDEVKTVQPWTIDLAKKGMEMVTNVVGTEDSQGGTAAVQFVGDPNKVAGKTGTAEYCDDFALRQGLCGEGIRAWPAHAWFVAYAPYDDPEIVVMAFAYNGTEGSQFSAPVVRKVIDAYFKLKAYDQGIEPPQFPAPGGEQ